MPLAEHWSRLRPAVFLSGPTATGKTGLAVDLVQQFPFEILSVDSAMVYCGMDIGTGKPSREILACAPHRLIDIRDPAAPYSAGQFLLDAEREMSEVWSRGRIPLLVGGTGLYFRALRDGFSPLPPANPRLRARLSSEAREHGWPRLHRRLAKLDPLAAERIHPRDRQRIQRALEVMELTGHALSDIFSGEQMPRLAYSICQLALQPADRQQHREAIARRFHAMLALGFVDEVQSLHRRRDLHRGLASVRAVGYRQVWDFLDRQSDYGTMVARAISATHQLAKRQLTWLRAEQHLAVFNSQDQVLHRRVSEHLKAALSRWLGDSRRAASGRV
jgi:tRNA dimethylallyltransferase